MTQQLLRSLGIVVLVSLAIRACWILVGELLAPLGVLLMLAFIGYLLFAGPRYRR